jgi:hypothetical protein
MNDAAAAAAIEERPLRRWLFVCFFALFALSSHGYIDNSDAEVEYQTARAIALRGSAALSAAHEDASPARALHRDHVAQLHGRPRTRPAAA